MFSENIFDNTADSVDDLYDVLQIVWESMSGEYEIKSPLPDSRSLFNEVDLKNSCIAAEIVVRNMLIDVTQLVDRFTPWYSLPARSFGLVSYRDIVSHKTKWRLAPEALKKWSQQIEMLAAEFDQKSGLFDAVVLISGIDILDKKPIDTVVASCECNPPNEILVTRAFLENNPIICKECEEEFLLFASTDH